MLLAILLAMQAFDEKVTMSEEILDLPNGKRRAVRTIHFGLGAAFYVSPDKTVAGKSVADGETWRWESHPELANIIHETIESAEKGDASSFFPLPMILKKTDR